MTEDQMQPTQPAEGTLPACAIGKQGKLNAQGEARGGTCVVPSWRRPKEKEGTTAEETCAQCTRRGAVLHSREQLQHGPCTFSAHRLEGPGEYRLGMIDILQKWSWQKRLERMIKILLCRCSSAKRNGMSCVEPNEYARRFHVVRCLAPLCSLI